MNRTTLLFDAFCENAKIHACSAYKDKPYPAHPATYRAEIGYCEVIPTHLPSLGIARITFFDRGGAVIVYTDGERVTIKDRCDVLALKQNFKPENQEANT